MARTKKGTPPAYRQHSSGQAVVTVRDQAGQRRDMMLGPWNSPQSHEEYSRILTHLASHHGCYPNQDAVNASLTVGELILAFWKHAEQHYRHEDGTPTGELVNLRYSFRPLKELFATLPAAEFSPLKLKAIRQRMIDAGLCRTLINKRIGHIVRMYRWAVAEEIVAETVHRAIAAVQGLQQGRTEARETDAVKPVAEAVVNATLPYMLPQVRAMVELQLSTGARPGEVRIMRGCDLDTSGDVWLYRPAHHKTRYRGKDRIIAIGPKGQEIVKTFLKLDTQAYLFSPKDAMEYRRILCRRNRKSPVQPSQQNRAKRNPKRRPGDCYNTRSYQHAVIRAIAAANKAQACKPCKKLKPEERCADCKATAIPHWHPHQLRHAHATEVRRRFGLEAAQVSLGHSEAKITELYAERDLALAAKVAKEIG